MANTVDMYMIGLTKFMDGTLDWDTDTFGCLLLNTGYTPNLATHDFVADVDATELIGTGYTRNTTMGGEVVAVVASKCNMTASDIVFSSLNSDNGTITDAVIFVQTPGTSDADRRVIFHLNFDGAGIVTNGSNVTISFTNGIVDIDNA